MNELDGSYVNKASTNINYKSRIAGGQMSRPTRVRLKTGSSLEVEEIAKKMSHQKIEFVFQEKGC